MRHLQFDVVGVPGAQGSKVKTAYGPLRESSKKVAPWRQDVVAAAQTAMGDGWVTIDGPARVLLLFRFRRPKSHYGTGRNAGVVKASAPRFPVSRAHGDGDKLERSTWDALVLAGVVADDALFVVQSAAKRWCHAGESPGATVRVGEIGP